MQPMFPDGVLKSWSPALGAADAEAAARAATRNGSRASAFIALHSVTSSRRPKNAPGRIRTSDPRIRSPPLCPLSYRRRWVGSAYKQHPPCTFRRMSQTILQTNRGPIKIELFPEDAPKTVGNFEALAKKGF